MSVLPVPGNGIAAVIAAGVIIAVWMAVSAGNAAEKHFRNAELSAGKAGNPLLNIPAVNSGNGKISDGMTDLPAVMGKKRNRSGRSSAREDQIKSDSLD